MKLRQVCTTCGGHANLRDAATYAGHADNIWPCPDCAGTGWAFAVCEYCKLPQADQKHPQWPADFQPQGPDDVPPGFCNGIGCAPGAQGEAGNNHVSCASHCCQVHGCKYGHDDCPVATKQIMGVTGDCETCGLTKSGYYDGLAELEDELAAIRGETPPSQLARVTLKKYIQHIGEVEGVDFIPEDQADQVRHVVNHFQPEELALLHELRREILEKR
jgi:hypothetical protein